MTTIASTDAKESLAQLIEETGTGDEILIVNRGEPLARLGPPGTGHDVEQAREAIRRLRAMARSVPEPKITTDEILEWIKEGRQR
ncbi:MAG: type II toxin-antitoxin system prevent-host-death family antitoxin [Chloroflexia bacterium]|nr:type II toxin-antitoxin system prevent-host-death family antitoxin [Chloroflexia bacterium]